MNQKFKRFGGFVQFPILIAIITSVIATAGIEYGVFEYKKISNLVGTAEQLTVEKKYSEANEKLETARNEWLVRFLGIQKENISSKIEYNEAKIGTEAIKQEIDEQEAKPIASPSTQTKKPVKTVPSSTPSPLLASPVPLPTPTPESAQQVELRIEKCKSEYTAKKSQRITQYDNYQAPQFKIVCENIALVGQKNCIDSCIETTGLDPTKISGSAYALASDTCKRVSCYHWSSYVTTTTKAARDSELDKIESQLQVEYQQCLIQ